MGFIVFYGFIVFFWFYCFFFLVLLFFFIINSILALYQRLNVFAVLAHAGVLKNIQG